MNIVFELNMMQKGKPCLKLKVCAAVVFYLLSGSGRSIFALIVDC